MKRVNMEMAVGLFLLVGIACLGYLSIRLGKLEILRGDTVPVVAEFKLRRASRPARAWRSRGWRSGGSTPSPSGLQGGRADGGPEGDRPAGEDAIASIRTRGLIRGQVRQHLPGASDRLIPPGAGSGKPSPRWISRASSGRSSTGARSEGPGTGARGDRCGGGHSPAGRSLGARRRAGRRATEQIRGAIDRGLISSAARPAGRCEEGGTPRPAPEGALPLFRLRRDGRRSLGVH